MVEPLECSAEQMVCLYPPRYELSGQVILRFVTVKANQIYGDPKSPGVDFANFLDIKSPE